MIIYLFLLISVIALAHSDCNSETAVCETKLCKVLADDIMSHVNLSVSPFVDPKGFNCRNYSNVFSDVSNQTEIVHKVLEEDYNGSQIIAAFPKLYRSCAQSDKDLEFRKQVVQFIAEIGGCPLLNKTWSKTYYNLETAVGILMAKHGINTLFSLYVYGINEIIIGRHSENVKALENKTRFYRLFQSFSDHVLPSDELDRTMSELLYFQHSINKEWTSQKGSSYATLPIKVEKFRLNENISTFNWTTLLDTISVETGVPISNDTLVSENFNGYAFNGLPKLLQRFPKQIIANFIVLKLLDTYNLDRFFPDEPFVKIKEKTSLHLRCLKFLGQRFGYIFDKLLIDRTVNTAMRKDLNKITQIATFAVNGYIDKLHWMDNETKIKAHEKIQKIKVIIGFDEYFKDSKSMIEAFEKQYPALKKISGFNFAKAMSLYHLGEFKDMLSQLISQQKEAFNLFTMNPKSNDFYIVLSGEIFYPLYVKNGPFVFNVAAFGSIMAAKLFEKIQRSAKEIFTQQTLEKYENLMGNRENIFEAKLEADLFQEVFKAFKAYVDKNGKPESSLRLPGLLTNYSISTDFLLSYTNLKCLLFGPHPLEKVTPIVLKEYAHDMLKRC